MPTLRERMNAFTTDLPPSYWFLWVGTVINRLGGFVIPFLSLYLTSQRGIPIAEAGLIVSLFGAGSFAAQLLGGELADRLGRRPVLLLSLLITPPVTVALGLARQLPLIAGLTLVLGFFTDLYRPAVNAAVADLVPPAARTRAFGTLYWAINLGAALAPILAGLAAHINYLLLFVGDALTTLVYGLIVLWRVPESQPAEASRAAHTPAALRLRQLGREPILLAFSFLALLFGIIYMQGNVTLPLDMLQHGLGPSDYGLAIAANGILIVLTTIQVSKAVTRLPRFSAVALAALLLGAGFGLTGLATNMQFFVLTVVVWTFGEIIAAAVAPTIIADLAPVELRGLYQGVFGSAWGLSFFIGPALGSWVFQSASPDALWVGCAVLGAVLAAAYLLLAGPAHRRLRQPAEADASQGPA
jgi:MFS family permease